MNEQKDKNLNLKNKTILLYAICIIFSVFFVGCNVQENSKIDEIIEETELESMVDTTEKITTADEAVAEEIDNLIKEYEKEMEIENEGLTDDDLEIINMLFESRTEWETIQNEETLEYTKNAISLSHVTFAYDGEMLYLNINYPFENASQANNNVKSAPKVFNQCFTVSNEKVKLANSEESYMSYDISVTSYDLNSTEDEKVHQLKEAYRKYLEFRKLKYNDVAEIKNIELSDAQYKIYTDIMWHYDTWALAENNDDVIVFKLWNDTTTELLCKYAHANYGALKGEYSAASYKAYLISDDKITDLEELAVNRLKNDLYSEMECEIRTTWSKEKISEVIKEYLVSVI